MASRGERRGWASGPYPLRNLLVVANRRSREVQSVKQAGGSGPPWSGQGVGRVPRKAAMSRASSTAPGTLLTANGSRRVR